MLREKSIVGKEYCFSVQSQSDRLLISIKPSNIPVPLFYQTSTDADSPWSTRGHSSPRWPISITSLLKNGAGTSHLSKHVFARYCMVRATHNANVLPCLASLSILRSIGPIRPPCQPLKLPNRAIIIIIKNSSNSNYYTETQPSTIWKN